MSRKALVAAIVILLAISVTASAMLPEPAINKRGANTPGLEKIVFIHYKKGAKPPWAGSGKSKSTCYDFLGKGVKWRALPISYIVNPDNGDDLDESYVTAAIHSAAEEWDNHTSTELFSDVFFIDYSATWDGDAPDGRNEMVFDYYPDSNVIAVTVVWGYFTGPPSAREIREFDILFNDNYLWGNADPDNDGNAENTGVMDLQNIATHELGHGIGLDDLYEDVCYMETMYGYSDYGEVIKRDLNTGDIAGLHELYGE